MPRKKEVVSGTFVKYDAVVLGSGPAGEGAAMKLAKSGKRVAIIDMREQLGGDCTHVGTIPSKALRQTVSSIIRYQRDPMFQKVGDWKQFTMKQVLRNAHKVIQQQVETHSRFYDRNKIDIYHGRAYIQDQNTVLVFTPDGIKETIMFKQLVIAQVAVLIVLRCLILIIRVYLIQIKFWIWISRFRKSSFMVQV